MTSTTRSRPWLSILIPTYNGERYLPAALDSIISQGDFDVECIVIDDGSTDSTLAVLDRVKDKIPTQVYQPPHQGNWVASTNQAISLAKGEYVCFLHQDDVWLAGRLRELRKRTLEFPEAVMFLHPSIFIDEEGNLLGVWNCPFRSFPHLIDPFEMVENLLIQNFISIPAPIIKRETLLSVGSLDESLWYAADWDLWLRVAAHGKTMYVPTPLSGFRVHPESQTVVRSSSTTDFHNQLQTVYGKHLSKWSAPEHLKKEINKIALFSIEVNTTLASFIHHRQLAHLKLAISFLMLGPGKAYRYVQVSRILDRVSARLKTQLLQRRNGS